MKTALMLVLFLICGWGGLAALHAQNHSVGGEVTGADNGAPIVGATVFVEGTGIATITDTSGRFSLNVPEGSTLSVSSLGYETQRVVASANGVQNISLQPQTFDVEEVVVVGTVMRKSDLTGAVAGVNAKVLAEKPVTSVNQALQGRLAGVFISQGAKPTDEASIRIRGINTMNTSTEPIYVVDGVVMDNNYNGFSATNVSDIASVEVLKDASATALYGNRGANGVVVITTKKGQPGEGRVSYDGWVGVQTFGYQPELMNTSQLYDTRATAFTNGFIQNYINNHDGAAPSESQILDYVTGNIDTPDRVFTQAEAEAVGAGKSYNWLDRVTRKVGIQHNHVLSFSGANDKASFYLSFGYMDNKGLIEKTEQTRYTGRVNADYKIKKWLTVGTNTSYINTFKSTVPDNVFFRARSSSPFLEPNDTAMYTAWNVADNNSFNPIRSLRIDNHERLNRLTSSNFVNIQPIPGLNIRTTLAMDHATSLRNSYIPNDLGEAERDSHHGRAQDDRDTYMMLQWDNSISYNTTIGKHRINAMVGTTMQSTKKSWINARSDGFSVNDFTYHNMGANNPKNIHGLSSDWEEQALMSYIARAGYTYDDRYMITATARYDGSSKFAPGYKWGLFPSVSVAWNIAEESFMENQNVFDQLKLRAGFGAVGNQNIPDFMFKTLYYTDQASQIMDGDGRRGTPNISWEKQQQWNLGLDMAFLNNRITFSIDAFLIDNKDLLMRRELPNFTTYKNAYENIGVIRNKGIEFSFDAAIIESRDFRWNFSGTFSLDRNKVTKLWGGRTFIHSISDNNINNEGNLFVGYPRNSIFMIPAAGIAQQEDMWYINTLDLGGYSVAPGDYFARDVNGDGRITSGSFPGDGDRTIVGSTDPKFYGGFATDFSWKGLALNAVFTYSYGAKRVGGWYNDITGGYGDRMTSTDLLNNTWTPENTGADFPRLLANNAGVNRWGQGSLDTSLQDASYLRLSTLTLSYTFPSRITNAIRMSNLRVYATGTNLFCITPYKGYDPEYGDWYPATRMWTFGLNLSF